MKLPKVYVICDKCRFKKKLDIKDSIKKVGKCSNCNNEVWEIKWE